LQLKKPQPDKEGVKIAGNCNHHDERHIFEFNDETHQGSRIGRLTPITPITQRR
jgi:hypothetical protein